MYKRMFGGEPFDELILKSDVATIATGVRDDKSIQYTRTTNHWPDIWRGVRLAADRHADGPDAGRGGQRLLCSQWRMDRLSIQSISRDEVYVQPDPAECDVAGRTLHGGTQPLWRGDGQELFFLALDGSVMSAAITTSQRSPPAAAEIVFGAPVPGIRCPYAVTA
jgi:hypothetical protein